MIDDTPIEDPAQFEALPDEERQRFSESQEALGKEALSSLEWQAGCNGSGPPGSGCEHLHQAVALASRSDVSIVVLGDGKGQCGEWQDRDELDSPGGQLQLLEAVAGKTRVMEDEFITASGTDVTDAFRLYLRPLLGSGMPDAFRLRPNGVAKVLNTR